jgi:hypothetical protein
VRTAPFFSRALKTVDKLEREFVPEQAVQAQRRAAQMLLTVAEAMFFNFTPVQASNALSIRVGTGIDMSRFKDGKLVVRVHSLSMSTGQTLVVEVYDAWPYPPQPELSFEGSSPAASVSIASTDAAGAIKTSLISGMGPALTIVVKGTQPSSVATVTALLRIGIEAWEHQ